MSMREVLRMRQRLSQAARRTISRAGLTATVPCEQMLSQFVANGVQRMAASNALALEDKAQLAENSLRRVVQEMARRATASGTFPMIDEHAFVDAQRQMCPAWPFC